MAELHLESPEHAAAKPQPGMRPDGPGILIGLKPGEERLFNNPSQNISSQVNRAAVRKSNPLPKITEMSLMDLDEEEKKTPVPDLSKEIEYRRRQARIGQNEARSRSGIGRAFRAFLLFMIVLVLMGACLAWLYPQWGQSAFQSIARTFPMLNHIFEFLK